MKHIFLFFIILIATYSTAQDESKWTLYKSVFGVEVYTQEVDCYAENIPAQKAIIIKVVNTNSSKISIEWDTKIWYNDELVTRSVKDGENHHTLELEGNQTISGSCDVPFGALYIYKDFITYVMPSKLTKFELENITVKQF